NHKAPVIDGDAQLVAVTKIDCPSRPPSGRGSARHFVRHTYGLATRRWHHLAHTEPLQRAITQMLQPYRVSSPYTEDGEPAPTALPTICYRVNGFGGNAAHSSGTREGARRQMRIGCHFALPFGVAVTAGMG